MSKWLFIFGIMVFMISPAGADWSGTSGDLKVSYFPGTTGDFLSRFPRVRSGGGSILYSAWVQGKTFVPYEIFFSKSIDNGRNWTGSSADFRISADDGEGSLVSIDNPVDLVVWNQDNICVVWAESLTNVGFEVMLVNSTDGGDTWEHSDVDFPISFPGGPRALAPSIAADNSGGLHVVWHQRADYDTTEIYYGYSSDGGATWTSQTEDRIISFADGRHANYPAIAIDADDNVYVAWTERLEPTDITSTAVHYGIKLAGDTQFSSETQDLTAAMPHRSASVPSIAVGPDFAIHIAYEATNDIGGSFKGAIYYTQSPDGGATWSGNTQEVFVDLNPFDDTTSADPTMIVTTAGNLAACYDHVDLSTGGRTEPRVSLSTDNGATWSGNTLEEIVGHWETPGDNRPGYKPHMCVSDGDTLHVVWNEDCSDEGGSPGYYEIMYSRGDVLGISAPACDYVVGDYNANGMFNVADIIAAFSYLQTGSPEAGYLCECPPGSGDEWAVAMDVNNTCAFNIADIIAGFSKLQTGSPDLVPCQECPPQGR